MKRKRNLSVGIYSTDMGFRNIYRHVAVVEQETRSLIALTGPEGDPESHADARLFAEAENMLQLLRDAPVGVATSGERVAKWMRLRDEIIERIEAK